MGVTYKLKQEVIDLIVQKKKETPSLSCRRLADLLYQAFNIEVSKSSINAVIKEYRLSNPVGRQAILPRKNFFIPKEKKQQLLTQVIPFLGPVVDGAPAPTAFEKPSEMEVKALEIPEIVPEDVQPLLLLPDPLGLPLIERESVPPESEAPAMIDEGFIWSADPDGVFENAGLWFVRAFMQDRLRRPVIGEVLARATGMSQEDADILEAAIFLSAWGVHSPADLHSIDLAGLWGMFELEPGRARDVLDRFLGKNIPLKTLAVMLEVELRAAMVEADLCKIMADTGRCYYLSPDLSKFLRLPTEEPPAGLLKGIELAIDRIVTAREPLLLVLPEGMDDAAKEFLLFLTGQAVEKPDKIEFWSQKHGTLWEHILQPGLHIRTIIAERSENDLLFDNNDEKGRIYRHDSHVSMGVGIEDKNIYHVLGQLFDLFQRMALGALLKKDTSDQERSLLLQAKGAVVFTRYAVHVRLFSQTQGEAEALSVAVAMAERSALRDAAGRTFKFSSAPR